MRCLVLALALGSRHAHTIAGEAAAPQRPELSTAAPLARVKLLTIKAAPAMPAAMLSAQPAASDGAANYQRTALGDWPAASHIDRDDPWLRLVVLGPKRRVIIDLAAFINGKPYRDAREAWIDQVVAESKSANGHIADVSLHADEPNEHGEGAVVAPEDSAPNSAVSAQSRQRPATRERVLSYVSNAGERIERDEIRWLIAEWSSGPAMIVMSPSLSWQRAGEAPLVALLDADRDGAFSADEIASCDGVLRNADFDQDDVVDERELRRAARHPPVAVYPTSQPLLVAHDEYAESLEIGAAAERIEGPGLHVHAAAHAGAVDDRLNLARELGETAADVTLRVDFSTNGDNTTGAALLAIGPNLPDARPAAAATGETLVFDAGVDCFEFSAAAGDVDDVAATQIAVGAAIDGWPLTRLIDLDQDRRITRREREKLPELLAALDRDGDRCVAAAEIPVAIRLVATLGPYAHELLAAPVGAARGVAPRDAPSAPDWFASMDHNGDRDLSRDEFLGTTEQFRHLDADGDGLISLVEASNVDIGN